MISILFDESSLRKKLLDACNRYAELSDKHTLSIGLIYDGKTYILNRNENEKKLRYDIGSISKTMTAHIVMKLL